MALLLPQQSEVLFAYSVLADLAPGYTAFNDHQAYYNAHGQAGYESALNSIFAGYTNAQLGQSLLDNTGLGGIFTAADAEAYVASHASNRAGAMIAIANALYYYAGTDAALLAAHNAYVTRIDASYAYSATSNNTSSADLDGLASTADTFTLTHSTDKATANIFEAPQVYTPGGDDRINSLQDEDNLTGTGTNPTLTTTLGNANDNGATIITPTLDNIETLNAAFTGSGGAGFAVTDLDLQDATGLKTVNITRVSAGTNTAEVANIMSRLDLMTVTNSNSNQAGGVEFSFTGGVLNGAAGDTGRLELQNVQLAALNVGQNTSGVGAALGVGGQGYEYLTIESKGSPNAIGAMGLPMNTGTDGKITLEGDANLTIGTSVNVTLGLGGPVEAVTHAGGILGNAGRLQTLDASAMTGSLNITLGPVAGSNILSAGKAETSGQPQNVTVTGTAGADQFWLGDVVGKGDVINGGDGSDTLVVLGGGVAAGGLVSKVENTDIQFNGAAVTLDFDSLPDSTLQNVRNIGNAAGISGADAGNWVVTLSNLTAAQAGNLSVQHGTTGNNHIDDTTIQALLKSDAGAADTVKMTLNDGANTNPRFNFILDNLNPTTAVRQGIENVSFVDNDTESNTVLLPNFAKHTGTITISGGLAGTFFNLDADTALADVTANKQGADGLAAGRQLGIYGYDVEGTATDLLAGSAVDLSTTATEVRFGSAKIDASAATNNVIVRVSTNAASAVGAQEILMGTGDDTVIFDFLSDNRAGLTISDTVKGNTGNDTLVIDGNAVAVTLGASEWTNVSGFENIRLVGLGGFAYNLTLTNDLIANNATGGIINIINDNDKFNDTASAANTVTVAPNAESAVTLDARLLDANHSFSYNGEENGTHTADRFIMTDPNINGKAVIDGGAVDNVATTNDGPNGDVLEVRNAAVVTAGDLAGTKNVGTIAFNNDSATAQVLNLQLNDTTIDAMIDSYHASGTGLNVENLIVNMEDAGVAELDIAGVTLGLIFDMVGTTAKSQVTITLNNNGSALAVTSSNNAAADVLALSATGGYALVANFESALDAGTRVGGAGSATPDKIQLSKAAFAAVTSVVGAGFSVGTEFLANATGLATTVADRIIFNTATGDVWYDADGSAAGAAVRIATLTGVTDLAGGDFVIVA
jgi:hypothetical protein